MVFQIVGEFGIFSLRENFAGADFVSGRAASLIARFVDMCNVGDLGGERTHKRTSESPISIDVRAYIGERKSLLRMTSNVWKGEYGNVHDMKDVATMQRMRKGIIMRNVHKTHIEREPSWNCPHA